MSETTENHPARKRSKLGSRIVLCTGMLFLLAGAVFFFGSYTDTSNFLIFASLVSIIIGFFFGFLAIQLRKRSTFLFFASFFIIFGFFLLLSALRIIPVTFRQYWPLLSVFAGISLIPAGWHHYHKININYIVCALLFIALGFFLLFFSFHLMPVSFKTFLQHWWPLLAALAGLVLILLALSSNRE